MTLFGIELGAVDWVVLGTSAITFLGIIRSIISALKQGTDTIKSIANAKIDNAQERFNNFMDATNTKLQDLETQVDFWKSEAENLQGTIVSINQQNQQNQQLIEEVLNNEI